MEYAMHNVFQLNDLKMTVKPHLNKFHILDKMSATCKSVFPARLLVR